MLLALDRKEKDVALRISDALRRHRFYTSLPLGGRVLNLRWTLEAPPESLTQTALLHRQELMNRYPDYVQLSQEAQKLRAELAALPVGSRERRSAEATGGCADAFGRHRATPGTHSLVHWLGTRAG